MAPTTKKRIRYTKEDLLNAVSEVKNGGGSIRKIGAKYNIPSSTLNERVNGKYEATIYKKGRPPKIEPTLEDCLANFVIYRAKMGFGVSRKEIRYKVKEMLDGMKKECKKESRGFKNNLPPKAWITRFIERHPEILIQIPEQLERGQNKGCEQSLRQWFENLRSFLREEHALDAYEFLEPENAGRIFYIDESSYPLCVSTNQTIMSQSSLKDIDNVRSKPKDDVIVLGCVSGDGYFHKPFVIYNEICSNSEYSEVYHNHFDIGQTTKNIIDSDLFLSWLSNLFYDCIKDQVQFPIIVFMDGHSSYINVAVIDFAIKHNIILYCLPRHHNNTLQPLGISIHRPLKQLWDEAVKNFTSEYNETLLHDFISVFYEVWNAMTRKPDVIIEGFKNAGLIPFNPNAVDYSKAMKKISTVKFKYKRKMNPISTEQKLGIAKCLKILESNLTKENLVLFKNRWKDNYNVDDDTNLGQLWKTYSMMKQLLCNMTPYTPSESQHDFNDTDSSYLSDFTHSLFEKYIE